MSTHPMFLAELNQIFEDLCLGHNGVGELLRITQWGSRVEEVGTFLTCVDDASKSNYDHYLVGFDAGDWRISGKDDGFGEDLTTPIYKAETHTLANNLKELIQASQWCRLVYSFGFNEYRWHIVARAGVPEIAVEVVEFDV